MNVLDDEVNTEEREGRAGDSADDGTLEAEGDREGGSAEERDEG